MDKIQQLTFSRFIAAVAIIVYHFGQKTSLYQVPVLHTIFENANVAVSFFYVLSGFVLYYSYAQKKEVFWISFLIKRLRRIYPAYFIAILFTLLIKTFHWDDVLLSLFMVQTWIPGKSLILNNPGWSISNELFFYASFPLLLPLFKTYKQIKAQGFAVFLFWLVSQLFFLNLIQSSQHYYLYLPILHINSFIVGVMAARFFQIHSRALTIYSIALKILLLAMFVVALYLFENKNLHNGLLAPLFALLIYLIARGRDAMTRFFSRPLFQFLGEISYSLYIFQFPVWLLISEYRLSKYLHLPKTISEDLKFSIRFLLLVLFSIGFYYFVEKPIQRYYKNKN